MDSLLHKFYAASISIGTDGSMLVASTRERVLAWAAIFCLAASVCLIAWLAGRKTRFGKAALVCFVLTLSIPVLVIPSVRNEYIHVSRTEMTVETGEWYRPSRIVLPMTDVRRIRESGGSGIIPGNLIGDPDVSWHITWRNGNSETFKLNDFFNAHRMVVAYYYIDRGYWLERLEDQSSPTM